MKHAKISTQISTLGCLLLVSSSVWADGDYKCEIPKTEMRPQMELQKKLKSEGWKIRMVQTMNGCYEVYGFDANKKRVEAFFDPKTFKRLDVTE